MEGKIGALRTEVRASKRPEASIGWFGERFIVGCWNRMGDYV
jgi:hypothetical protein